MTYYAIRGVYYNKPFVTSVDWNKTFTILIPQHKADEGPLLFTVKEYAQNIINKTLSPDSFEVVKIDLEIVGA